MVTFTYSYYIWKKFLTSNDILRTEQDYNKKGDTIVINDDVFVVNSSRF